jgi:phytoene dehydrogenase-like protein
MMKNNTISYRYRTYEYEYVRYQKNVVGLSHNIMNIPEQTLLRRNRLFSTQRRTRAVCNKESMTNRRNESKMTQTPTGTNDAYRAIMLLILVATTFVSTTKVTTDTKTLTTTKTTSKMSLAVHAFAFSSSNNNNRRKHYSLTRNKSSLSTAMFMVTNNNGNNVDDSNPLYDDVISTDKNNNFDDEVDIAIIGAGIGGLAAGAILNTLYNKKVGIYESHYLPGGCAHAFERLAQKTKTDTDTSDKKDKPIRFTFDSGPTIVLGCSQKPFNALRQVLDAVDQSVDWIRYDGWGMIEHPKPDTSKRTVRWKCELGPNTFQQGPLLEFGGQSAVDEFEALRQKTKDLTVGIGIPAMAMRPGSSALIPLLKYFPTLVKLLSSGPEKLTGTFEAYMDGPEFTVKNKWLRDWLDALAFSLSGLPASRTAAAAMAFIVDDMHRDGAALDYPKGGFGSVIDALCRGVEQPGVVGGGAKAASKIHLRTHVDKIDFTPDGSKASGITLKNGRKIVAREGVICNAPVWSLRSLIRSTDTAALDKLSGIISQQPQKDERRSGNENKNDIPPPQTWIRDRDAEMEGSESKYSIRTTRSPKSADNNDDANGINNLLNECDTAEMTGSFLHLHVAIDSTGLDLSQMEAHYTVMDRGLSGDPNMVINGVPDGPCGELNMIAVSNPCVIDPTLAPDGYMVLHAYGAGNEPYDIWKKYRNDRNSPEYKQLKEERSEVLWRALESVIPDVKDRIVLDLVGSPLTHERFLRRPMGTYGSATEDYLKDGSTPIQNLVLAGDQIFPGIGIPAVAISGASAANAMVNPLKQWTTLDSLKESGRI